MSPRLRLGSRACQIGGTALGVGSRGPQRCRGKSIPATMVGWVGGFYMGVALNGGTPKTPQNDHF